MTPNGHGDIQGKPLYINFDEVSREVDEAILKIFIKHDVDAMSAKYILGPYKLYERIKEELPPMPRGVQNKNP